jgi:hypothetical protein
MKWTEPQRHVNLWYFEGHLRSRKLKRRRIAFHGMLLFRLQGPRALSTACQDLGRNRKRSCDNRPSTSLSFQTVHIVEWRLRGVHLSARSKPGQKLSM